MARLYGYITNTNNDNDNNNYYQYISDSKENVADETWKYVLPIILPFMRFRNIAVNPGSVKLISNTEKMVKDFFDINNPKLEQAPENYQGNRNMSDILNYLGSKDNNSASVKSPIEDVTFNRNNLYHFLEENEPERLQFLNRTKRTIEDPYYIIREFQNGKTYNGYYKPFKDNNRVDGFFDVIKNAPDGNFYSTSRPIRANNLRDKINNGQVIYNNLPDQTAPISNDIPVNNIITDNARNFNPSLFERIIQIFNKNK